MSRLKLGPVEDDKPVRLTIDVPPAIHRDLVAYAQAHREDTGQSLEPARLVVPMLVRFMASDRGFLRAKRALDTATPPDASSRPQHTTIERN